jgi:hypothetical protein
MEGHMVRRPDRPLRNVRVSFETTRFSAQHLIDAYAGLVPTVRRARLQPTRGPREGKAKAVKTRRGEA